MKEGQQLSLREGRGVGNFTFLDINVRTPNVLSFRIPKSITDNKTNLPHIIYANGEHLPHPQLVTEIFGWTNK